MSRFGLGFLGTFGGNDNFTKSLLHLDGTNGSTTITDTAAGLGTNLVWTCVGNSLSTATVKFGTASLLNAATQYITTPNNAAFNALGTTPFVFDCWINTSNSGTAMFITAIGFIGGTFSFLISRNAGNTLSFLVNSGGSVTVTTAGTVSSAGWHHVAGIFDGSKIYIALDGVVSAGVSCGSIASTTGSFDIGAAHFSAGVLSTSFVGNIDEARLSIGTTRGWTSNFSPPSSAYFQ